MKLLTITFCCLALTLATSRHDHDDDHPHPERADHKNQHQDKGDRGGNRDGNGLGVSHSFGKRSRGTTDEIEKRDTSVHGHVDHDKDGIHVGGEISHSSQDGKTHVDAHVEHSTKEGTSVGVSGSHTWSHSGGSKTTVSGEVSHGSHGTSGGVSVTHTFGRRLAELEEAVREMERRDTTAHGHVEHDKDGTHAGAGVEHNSNDDKTHTEAHVEHSTKGGSSYGGSFSHTFGKRDLENALNDILKRDSTVHGHVEHDKDGTHVGAGVEHHSNDDKTHVGAHVEHSTKEGTNYGVDGSHTWSHSGGSKTTVSGGVSHGSHGTSGGVSVTHTFGRRLAELEEAVREMERRDTTVHGHVEHDKHGTHAEAGVEHNSKDDKTHTEAHVEHSTKGGSSYGGSFSHTFGKRDLENALIDILIRDISVDGHVDHDKDGTHVGAGVEHNSNDDKTHVGAHVEHSTKEGTSVGVSGSHTWSHSGGSETTVSGGVSHGSHGTSGGVSVTHTFGRRLAELEEAVREMERRDTTVHGHVEHDKDGTHAEAGVEHNSKDDKTHTEAHVEHSTKEGSSYGGSFSHTFGKRDLENTLKDILEKHWHWHSKDGKTHAEAHVRHNDTDGTSYGGGSFSHTFGKRDLDNALYDILKRDISEHDKDGTRVGTGVEHHSKDDKTHAETHVEHITKWGKQSWR